MKISVCDDDKRDIDNLIEQDFYGTEGMTKLLDFAKQWVGTI